MATKPVIIDFSTKYCADIMQPLFDMVWDGLGESPVPVDVRTHIDAAPTVHTHDHLTDLVNTGLPDCHPTSAITGLDTVLTALGQVDSVVEGNNITVDATDPRNPIVSAAGVGAIAHNDLGGRDVADAHPLASITGINSALVAAKSGRKNLALNGSLRVHQRTPTNSTTVGAFGFISADAWSLSAGGAATLATANVGTDANAEASFTGGGRMYLSSLQAFSVTAGTYCISIQHVESRDIAQLLWGTPDAKAAAFSFSAISNVAGTFFATVRSADGQLSYVMPFTLAQANVKEQFDFSIPGPTSGVWDSANKGIGMIFSASVGSTYQCPATLAWTAGNNYLGAAGGTNLGANIGDRVSISDVQFEEGAPATAFEFRHYEHELALCRRRFKKDIRFFVQSNIIASGSCALGINFDIHMLATPTAQNYRASNVNLGSPSFVTLSGKEAVLTIPGVAVGNCTMNVLYDFSAEI